jgi:hypothetical protein
MVRSYIFKNATKVEITKYRRNVEVSSVVDLFFGVDSIPMLDSIVLLLGRSSAENVFPISKYLHGIQMRL